MFISTETPQAWKYRVYLDGKELVGVVKTANDETGEVLVYELDPPDQVAQPNKSYRYKMTPRVLDKETGSFKRAPVIHTLKGKVEIIYDATRPNPYWLET